MISLILFILLTVLLLCGSWYAYSIAFYSPKRKRTTENAPLIGEQYDAVAENINRISGIMRRFSYEEVTIKSADGTLLYGRYYHLRDNAPVKLLFHGYRSHPFKDCSGGHALARKMGFNTLVVDQRAHGSSGGHTISFGIKERHDCLAWIEYLNQRFGTETPILLSGISMGAATVLMAASLHLPDNVACIMADSPYSSPIGIIRKVCKEEGYPVSVCTPFLHAGALIYGGFQLNSSSAKDAVRTAKIPILLIHGEDDRFVPCEMSLEIAANCSSRVDVCTFPNAGHGLSYLTDPIRYERAVSQFLYTIPSVRRFIDPVFLSNLHDNLTE